MTFSLSASVASCRAACHACKISKADRVPVPPSTCRFSFWYCGYWRELFHFSVWCSRYSRVLSHPRFGYSRYMRVLSHVSFWYSSCSRVLSLFSIWYSGYDSRVLNSFQRSVIQILASAQSFQLLLLQLLESTQSFQRLIPWLRPAST